MKRIGLISILLGLGVLYAYPQDSIVSIPDAAFLHALIDEGVDTDGDTSISYTEAEAVNYIDVSGKNIWSHDGIEAFTNLDTLICSGNDIYSMDFSNNEKLRYLDCANQCEGDDSIAVNLSVTNNTLLKYLNCSGTYIISLDLSENTALEVLKISDMPGLRSVCVWTDSFPPPGVVVDTVGSPNFYFTTECLDFVHIPDEIFLQALIDHGVDTDGDRHISTAEAAAVTYLNFYGGGKPKFSDITGIEAFINLDTLICHHHEIERIVLSGNTKLIYLYCGRNPLEYLDISKCSELIHLDCSDDISQESKLTNLDLSNNPKLQYLACHRNLLTELDLSHNTALTYLDCSGNQLASLDLSNNPEIVSVDCSGNLLSGLNICCNERLEELSCENNQLNDLDLSGKPVLRNLYCSSNNLSNIDVSDNPELVHLSCNNNQLSSLDLIICTGLRGLDCSQNQLTSLDVSGNSLLEEVFCSSNQLTSLPLPDNPLLERVDCSNNQLTSLLLPAGSLSELNCSNNNLKTLDVSRHMKLQRMILSYLPTLDTVYVPCLPYPPLCSWDWYPFAIYVDTTGSPNITYATHWDENSVQIKDYFFLERLIDLGVDSNHDYLISFEEAAAVESLSMPLEHGGWGDPISPILDLTGIEAFVNLDTLIIIRHPIDSLDLSNNLKLRYLDCSGNPLKQLNVSNCINLEYLNLQGFYYQWNPSLTSLDISNNINLKYFNCSNNPSLLEVCVWELPFPPENLTIDTTGSPNIRFIQILDVPEEYQFIQEAIDAAGDGDIVLVADGTYLENIRFKGKAITVASQFILDGDTSHISNTIIDGSQPEDPDTASTVLFIDGEGPSSILCGFTITGGTGTLCKVAEYSFTSGGGIYLDSSGATVEHNIITDNHIDFQYRTQGGGICATFADSNELIIQNNIIEDNSVTSPDPLSSVGGGIAIAVPNCNYARYIVQNNKICNNVVRKTQGAGKGKGGGLSLYFFYPTPSGEFVVRNNRISNNSVYGTGELIRAGGLYAAYVFETTEDFYDSIPNPWIYNNIIDSNYAQGYGAGVVFRTTVYEGPENWHTATRPVFCNNTVVNNTSPGPGNGLTNETGIYPDVFNNIFWNDPASTEIFNLYEVPFEMYNNCVRGGWGLPEFKNISNDPAFIAGSYKLSKNSPCLGSGTDSSICSIVGLDASAVESFWIHAPSNDYYGNPRPVPANECVDIGAIESEFPDIVFIPDTAFLYSLIRQGVDINGDSLISYMEAEATKTFEHNNSCWNCDYHIITDLTGIEAFANLDTLIWIFPSLDTLDLSNNTSLRYLDLSGNTLAYLNVSKCHDLTYMNTGPKYSWGSFTGNRITNLNLSNNNKLEYLNCSHSEIDNLDLSNHPSLTELYFTGTAFRNLDVSNCKMLEILGCNGWNDSKAFPDSIIHDTVIVNASGCTSLLQLDCAGIGLTQLDVSNCPELVTLLCGGYTVWAAGPYNHLRTIDLTDNIALKELNLFHNALTSLDISNNPALEELNISNTNFNPIDEYPDIPERYIPGNGNVLTNLDISKNTKLTSISMCALDSLNEVCVWDGFNLNSIEVDTTGSPNVYFTTECATGIEKRDSDNIRIYPNPTSNLTNIELEHQDYYSIVITSLNGQLLYKEEMEGTTHQLDLSTFHEGLYIITISSKGFITKRKIIKM